MGMCNSLRTAGILRQSIRAVQGQGTSPYATMQCRLLRNIGVAFLQQGMYADARNNFDAVLRIRPDAACAFNRLICAYMVTTSVEQADALKQGFRDLVVTPQTASGPGDQVRNMPSAPRVYAPQGYFGFDNACVTTSHAP